MMPQGQGIAMYVRFKKRGRKLHCYLVKSYRKNGQVRQKTLLYLGPVSEGLGTTIAKVLKGKTEGVGTTLDTWKRYALWAWVGILEEALKKGDEERAEYAKGLLRWLVGLLDKNGQV